MRPGRVLAALVLGAGLCGAVPGGVRHAAAQAPGDPARGRAVFEAKGCPRCHVPRGQGGGMGPPREAIGGPQGAFHLAGRLWNHAPAMFGAFSREKLAWPELTRAEMADLMAHLQADPALDPAPDLFKGQATLVRKGCLKCHRLRGEGGAVANELTRDQTHYASPVAWATTIWSHAPQMAGHGARLGLAYPRFTGDEMANLVGFLRRTAAEPR
jgi:cytochrome c551/c552